ncbi:MAG: GDP-fucose synthetase [Hydrogenophilales bacterium CG_4_9_14_3_um_filter_63_34]|nr:MAG: GDP-fucose synthetase [Hydrogenophilales bacterium CG_4_10_14_3_um_filter_63_21]PJB02713.1 MAG: GDP-fucose synthetase [Hydrogenophilales bacterium CG_4_9_14_3_um_filter_63_34]
MKKNARIYLAGHRGLVGSALQRALARAGHGELITRSHAELDLTDPVAVRAFFTEQRPEYVFLAAAKVGGIHANDTYPVDFLQDNLLIETHVIREAWRSGVKKLLFLGSSCIYPKLCPQPIKEEYLLTGPLEPTNEAYALAKIAGIKLCQSYNRQYGTHFISAMPTNLYGPQDNFHPTDSHVLPALLRRFHEAKTSGQARVTVWGSGTAMREFLHCDDLAEACLHLMDHYQGDLPINIGWGKDCSIRELAETVAGVVGFAGEIVFDASKPDGTPRKVLDTRRLSELGFTPTIPLHEGIEQTYHWYLDALAAGQIKL